MVKQVIALKNKYSVSLFSKKFRESETSFADLITRFAGSMLFVYLHVIWFTGWILFSGYIGDRFPFGLLTMIVSLEAIFLSTFIMVNQNRQAEIAEVRASEDDEEQEEIAEDIEDIQEDFDTMQRDLADLRKLLARIETRYGSNEVKIDKVVPLEKAEKVHVSQISSKKKAPN